MLKHLSLIAAIALCAGASWHSARAEPLRVGKSATTVFSYTLLDVGIRQGIFAAHGLTLDVTGFGGGPKLTQAMLAQAIDIGIDTGPDMALIVKGAPMKVVGALAGRPDELALLIRTGAPVTTLADLRGKKVGVTSLASLTGWLTRRISIQQGWGPDGITLVPVANGPASMALLSTGQIDGLTQDTLSCLDAESKGLGHILLNYGTIAPDFHIQLFFATDALIAAHPDQLRAFLAAWYETIAWARTHRDQTIAIVAEILGRDPALSAKTYDLLRDDWSTDGRLSPAALAVLAPSFVELGLVDTPPDLTTTIDARFLPSAH